MIVIIYIYIYIYIIYILYIYIYIYIYILYMSYNTLHLRGFTVFEIKKTLKKVVFKK